MVGVPLITPVVGLIVNPGGKLPVSTEYVVAPETFSEIFTGPDAFTGAIVGAVQITGGGVNPELGAAFTVPVYALEVDPYEFVAVIVKLYAPVPVGVPVIAPVVAFKVNPAGRVPAEIEYEVPPVIGAAKFAAVPEVKVAKVVVAITGADCTVPVNLREPVPDAFVALIVKS